MISEEVAKGSDNKLPTKLISFILDSVLNHKKFDPKSLTRKMQDSIIDIILETFLGKDSKDLRMNIRQLILMIMDLIDAL